MLSSLDAYRSHDLSISMKTSSGDIINLDFSNEQSLNAKKGEDGSSLKFSSMQAFNFEMQSNGLDEQDKKEIAAFMKLAQPRIDAFMKEIAEQDQKSSVSKVAKSITDLLGHIDEKNVDFKALAKNSTVAMFDKGLEKVAKKYNFNAPTPETTTKNTHIDFEKLFKDSQKLLEKILQGIDNPKKEFYA